jgi:multicomponent Na+:H+ antiporter subunit E
MRRIGLRALMLCWLTMVWVLLWGHITLPNVLGGLAVALSITVLLPMPSVPVEGRVNPLALLRLVIRVAYYLVVSSIQMAWLAVRPGPPPPTAVLRARLHLRSELILSLAVNVINLIPGTIVLEIDPDGRFIYVHVLDVGSDRAIERFYHQIAEVDRLMIASFEDPKVRG